MMMKLNQPINLFLGILLILTSCKKEGNNNIIICSFGSITTIQYTLTPTSGGAPIVLRYIDLDGDGGDAPIISEVTLNANQTYMGQLELLDESKSSTEDVSEEVSEEAQYYQFFFESTAAGVEVTYDDQDTDGNPLGMQNILSTGNEGSGTLTMILLQESNKFANGVSDGEIENASGEIDLEISYPIIVQ